MQRQPGQGSHQRLRADRARQVADVLRQVVLTGEVGDRLAGESALQREFGVSRNTVRVALEILSAEGLIVRKQGVGSVIAARKLDLSVGLPVGMSQSVHGERRHVTNQVRTKAVATPPFQVREWLGLGMQDQVVYIERLRLLNDEPISLDCSYLPVEVGQQIVDADLTSTDLYRLLEDATGRRLGATSTHIEALAADRPLARLLRLPVGAPIMAIHRVTRWADDGTPADVEFHRIRGDAVAVTIG